MIFLPGLYLYLFQLINNSDGEALNDFKLGIIR